MSACTHLDAIVDVEPSGTGCVECLHDGSRWVHLRRCTTLRTHRLLRQLAESPRTAHFHETEHPIIQSFEPGEDWYWCYVDELAFEDENAPPSPSHP